MRKGFKIFLIILLVFVLVVTGGIIYLHYGQKEVNQTVITPIDLTNLEDGTYVGEYQGYRWSNKIEVKVENNQITEIKILKDVVFVKEGISEELFAKVIEQQNVDVDVISGSTITCKAYLKAIEDALDNK